jgi:DMSO/TMAO reductase YedYZ heme-binding membrane subunit
VIAGIYWDTTRASGNVAWTLMLFTILWGVLLTTRVLRGFDRPAWLLDLHKWLGITVILFTAIHIASLIADTYVDFSVAEVLVPGLISDQTWAISAGIIGFWLLLTIQLTSVFKRKLSKGTWRRIHMLSYPLYGIIAFHALTTGSDVGSRWYTGFSVSLSMTGAAVFGIRYVVGRSDRQR